MSYITQAELKVLQQFYIHSTQSFLPPKIRHLCDALGRSTATVQQHVNRLYRNGYLTKRVKDRRIARNYFLSEKGKKVFNELILVTQLVSPAAK